jgi:hypothetical protein
MWRPLRRLDRLVLVHAPLVWRTRLPHFIFAAVIGNATLYLIGSVQPVEPTRVPPIGTIEIVTGLVYIVGFGVLAYWAYVQYRTPLPECRASRYVALTLLHAACVLTVLASPLAYQAAILPRIADVVPDRAFADEYAYHAGHSFWLCGVDRAEAPLHSSRIDASLTAWGLPGLPADFELGWYSCDGLEPATMVRPPLSMLRDRMESVRAAKAQRDGESGAYPSRPSLLAGFALISLLLGAALLPALVPASVWRRRFQLSGRAALPQRLVLPRPAWLRRLDRRLVENRPLLWSLRLHTFAYELILGGGLTVLAATALARAFDVGEMDPFFVEGLLLIAAVAAFLAWVLVQRGIALHEPRLRGNRTALAAYLGFVLALSLLLAGVVALLGDGATSLEFLLLALVAGNYAAVWVYAAKYVGTGMAGLLLLGSAAILYPALDVPWTHPLAWLPVAAWAVATALVWRHRGGWPLTRTAALVAGAQLLLLPPVTFMAWFTLLRLVDSLMGDGLGLWLIMVPAVPLVALAHVFAATPAMRTLIRHRYTPRAA